MSKLIEMGKQYKTRSGLPVRVLCTDYTGGGTTFTVVAIVEDDVVQYTTDGRYFNNVDTHPYDLVEQPQEIVVWVEVFSINNEVMSAVHKNRDKMVESVVDGRNYDDGLYKLIATKRVVVTEGEMA